MDPSDEVLLQQYARHGSNDAFRELVRRHVNLVYSVARRQLGSESLAADVTQSVFTDLAKTARSLKPNSATS